MPSKKKPPPKKDAKGSKGGKGKKGKEKAKPLSRKEAKIHQKFGAVMVEALDGKEVSVVTLRRDELLWAIERTRDQVTANRSERIRYQLERDFLFELSEQYRKKLECLMIEQDALLAEANKAQQDADEAKIVKAMEGKHFRAETQMIATAQECRDELRRKRIQELLERSFMNMLIDMDEQDDLLARNREEYKKRIAETQKKLQDLHKYIADHEKQLAEFIENLEKEKKRSEELFIVIHKMENQLSEERWNEFIWKLSINFENSMKKMKHFYNDASFSNFTMMYTLQDMITSSAQRMDQYSDKITELQHMMQEAHTQMAALRLQFTAARVRHNRIVRTKQGITTVSKELHLTQNKTNDLRMDYRSNFVRLENINMERQSFRENGPEMVQNVLDAYSHRFKVVEDEPLMQSQVDKRDMEREKLWNYFKDPMQFAQVVGPLRHTMMQRNGLVEDYHLTSMKVRKQNENLRNSLNSRLHRVGLTRKHCTMGPKMATGFGSMSATTAAARGVGLRSSGRTSWGPANLVAGNSFQMRKQDQRPTQFVGDVLETAMPVCLTSSIQDFISWKKMQKDQKDLEKRKLMETEARVSAASVRYC